MIAIFSKISTAFPFYGIPLIAEWEFIVDYKPPFTNQMKRLYSPVSAGFGMALFLKSFMPCPANGISQPLRGKGRIWIWFRTVKARLRTTEYWQDFYYLCSVQQPQARCWSCTMDSSFRPKNKEMRIIIMRHIYAMRNFHAALIIHRTVKLKLRQRQYLREINCTN